MNIVPLMHRDTEGPAASQRSGAQVNPDPCPPLLANFSVCTTGEMMLPTAQIQCKACRREDVHLARRLVCQLGLPSLVAWHSPGL